MSPTSKTETAAPSSYTAKGIKVFADIEALRKRPSMYVRDTGSWGFHHLFQEVLSNSVDEYLAGHCSWVTVVLEKDNFLTVTDNGRGIPVDAMADQGGRSALEVVVTKLHAGGKWGDDDGGYKISGGLHGIGITAVNGLSETFEATVERDGGKYFLEAHRGIVKKPGIVKLGKSKNHGTGIRWQADPTIFIDKETGQAVTYERDILLSKIRQAAFLNPGLFITFEDKREETWFERSFCFEGGLITFVRHMVKGRPPVHPEPLGITYEVDKNVHVTVALQYAEDAESSLSNIHAFTNSIHNEDGGMHVTGFRTALTRELNNAARDLGLLKKDAKGLSGDDVQDGLCAALNLLMPGDSVEVEGQTKGRLGNSAARGWVDTATSTLLKDVTARQPDVIKKILVKCFENKEAREAARAAADGVQKRKGLSSAFKDKLKECDRGRGFDLASSELFIVEGDSAIGTAERARDRKTQALLAIKGKIENVEKAKLSKILVNVEVLSIIASLGAGVSTSFDLAKMRYGKVVLMADADDDGAHITTLLMTLFLRLTPGLIEAGKLYLAQPPLFIIRKNGKSSYAYSEAERVQRVKELGGGVDITRFKGLGEMDPHELEETTMNPHTRRILKLEMEDTDEMNEVVKTFMSADVRMRRHYVMSNAKDLTAEIEGLM